MRIIADAKYKLSENIRNRDYLQVLVYMFQFDARVGYYLYPETTKTNDLLLWMNKGSTYEANVTARDNVSVTKHGLKIPIGVQSYDAFVRRMRISEGEFRKAFITK